jgi:hypothetical protein
VGEDVISPTPFLRGPGNGLVLIFPLFSFNERRKIDAST